MPTERLDTLPRTERFAKLDWPAARNDPEVGIGSRYTLKLLVVSVLPDRSILLSSRSLMQWPRSYAPESGAHRGLHPFGQQILIELSQRIVLAGTGLRGRTLEEMLQIMIM